ncbi:MAG: HDOD domain-containing protein [Candidatus Zixiibacteriota bacterium]|nr:MAG: HDOD domain-containing protein [candidate division Zixibacteria bacterium]
MDTETVQTIFDQHKGLLSLPQTLAEVLRLVNDESSSAEDLAGVLEKDPALTAKVLRIVNSAFYGVGRQVGSVRQAVVTLGHRQISALALSSSVYNLTSGWEGSFDRVRFWRHSLEVAIASRLIAGKIGSKRTEEAFVSGLLHDLGLLVLEQMYPDDFSRVWRETSTGADLGDLEEDHWGTNHAKVARFMLEQWRLPETICQAVGMHHNVFLPGTQDEELILPQIVCLANHLSNFSIVDRSEWQDAIDAENRDALRENLGLKIEDLLAIQKELFKRTIAEAEFLEFEIGSTEDILAEANRMLFEHYVTVENLLKENRQMHQQMVQDQYRQVSLRSLRSTTATFAQYMDNAATAIAMRARTVQEGIERGAISDPQGLVRDSVNSIMSGVEAVCGMTRELKNFSSLDDGTLADEDKLAAVEEKLKRQLDSIGQPV